MITFKYKSRFVLLLAFCTIVAIVMHVLMGVRTGSDTERYLSGANAIATGGYLAGKQLSYRTYIYVLATIHKIGISIKLIVALQWFIYIAAALICNNLLAKLIDQRTAIIYVLLNFTNPDLLYFNQYILTDSMYTSLLSLYGSIVWLYFVYSWKGWPRVALLHFSVIAMTVVLANQRPTGFIVPVAIIFTILWNRLSFSKAIVIYSLTLPALLTLIIFVPSLRTQLENHDVIKSMTRGIVIWGTDVFRYEMNTASLTGQEQGDLIRFLLSNWIQISKTFLHRIVLEIIHIRPYYSLAHNVAIVSIFVPTYAFAIIGLRTGLNSNLGFRFSLAIIVFHLLLIGATFADYDGRFILYILPQIQIFAAIGLSKSWTYLQSYISSKTLPV